MVVWGVKAALPALAAISIPKVAAFVTTAAIVLAAAKIGTFNVSRETSAGYIDLDRIFVESIKEAKLEEEQKKKYNTNPFEGPVDEQVFVGDAEGNIIPVPEEHQLGGLQMENVFNKKIKMDSKQS